MRKPTFAITIAVAFSCSAFAAEPVTDPDPHQLIDSSVGNFVSYGGYVECISDLRARQVITAPQWDIAKGPPPMLPDRAEQVATTNLNALAKSRASGGKPLQFRIWRTHLVKYDAKRWYYSVKFTQVFAGTGGTPTIDVFVTFDGKVAPLELSMPPKERK